jgi:hypothetical protein
MASHIPALPRDSHVQSHAAVHKNKLCDSHAPLVARAIAGGWTRPRAAGRERQLQAIWCARLAGARWSANAPGGRAVRRRPADSQDAYS